MNYRWILMASAGLAVAVAVNLAAQAPVGQGNPTATFPAQQRALAEAAVIERGKGLYTTTCSPCHGADLRGGPTGGPNLLRSQVVLSDQHGELILPIVHGARAEQWHAGAAASRPRTSSPSPEYIHSVPRAAGVRAGRRQRRAAAQRDRRRRGGGRDVLRGEVQQLPFPTGDLQGVGSRLPEGKALQKAWVTGELAAAGADAARPPDRRRADSRGGHRHDHAVPRESASKDRSCGWTTSSSPFEKLTAPAYVPANGSIPKVEPEGPARAATRRCSRSSPTRTCTT